MNNSRRKWNIKQTNEDKLIRDFYSMACLWGSKLGDYGKVKLHKAYELVDKRYKND